MFIVVLNMYFDNLYCITYVNCLYYFNLVNLNKLKSATSPFIATDLLCRACM